MGNASPTSTLTSVDDSWFTLHLIFSQGETAIEIEVGFVEAEQFAADFDPDGLGGGFPGHADFGHISGVGQHQASHAPGAEISPFDIGIADAHPGVQRAPEQLPQVVQRCFLVLGGMSNGGHWADAQATL